MQLAQLPLAVRMLLEAGAEAACLAFAISGRTAQKSKWFGFGIFCASTVWKLVYQKDLDWQFLTSPIQAQVKEVSVWRHMPQMSLLAGKRLIDMLDLLMAWHLCSYYPKKRSQMNAKSNPTTVPQPAFYTAF